jgi:hypothetical protein
MGSLEQQKAVCREQKAKAALQRAGRRKQTTVFLLNLQVN